VPPDTDGDDVFDAVDNCPLDVNPPPEGSPNQDDQDGDGIGDVCDVDVDGNSQLDRGIVITSSQDEVEAPVILNTGGLVTIELDPESLLPALSNSVGEIMFNSIDWSQTDPDLSLNSAEGLSATFNPSGLQPGVYRISVDVTADMASGSGFFDLAVVAIQDDDGTGGLTGRSSRRLRSDLANLVSAVNLDPEADAVPKVKPGRYGVARAVESGSFASVDVAIPAAGFSAAAQMVDDTANPIAAFPLGVNRGIIDFEVTVVSPAETTIATVRLLEPLGTSGSVLVFDLDSRAWIPFVESADEYLGFMQFGGARCPPLLSTETSDISGVLMDYSRTAFPGANCLLIVARDGGPNDADQTADGVFRVTLGTGYAPLDSDCDGCVGVFLPNDADHTTLQLNRSSGGGAFALGLPILVVLFGALVALIRSRWTLSK